MEIILGCKVKDKITGFTGIVTSRTEWINGCIRIGVQPQEIREGRPVESQVFDLEQLDYVDEGLKLKVKEASVGGDRESIQRATDPQR